VSRVRFQVGLGLVRVRGYTLDSSSHKWQAERFGQIMLCTRTVSEYVVGGNCSETASGCIARSRDSWTGMVTVMDERWHMTTGPLAAAAAAAAAAAGETAYVCPAVFN